MQSKILIVVSFFAVLMLHAGEPQRSAMALESALQSSDSVQQSEKMLLGENESASRRNSALLYSLIMPGSGQTMLGHSYKGVSFSIAAFGSALTAAISHNNFIARHERLDALEYQYSIATNWLTANLIYTDMIGVQKKLIQDRDRRNIFLAISAVIWAANIVDLLYNTEDRGQTLFSYDERMATPTVLALDTPHKPLLSYSLLLY
jgi:hypothetical protein